MTKRIYNFNPGPAALPLEVLKQAKEQFLEYERLGMSLMEMSHRSKEVERLTEETKQLFLELLDLPDGYHVLFMGGGASAQFALVPFNFLTPETGIRDGKGASVGAYVLTGSFAEKAWLEAQYVGGVRIAASSKDAGWRSVPDMAGVAVDPEWAYVHVTTNNTIEGSRMNVMPAAGSVPLIADMTSDLMSRKLDFGAFSMIYAGAQKNLGPAGVTAVILRDEMLCRASTDIPVIMRYETFVREKSLYNTPPVHSVYMMNLMLQWTKAQGGIASLEARNDRKASVLYEAIDASGGFYRGIIDAPDRSHMNVTWRMPDERLERRFVEESERHGFHGLAGHRSVGGLRASAYNAVSMEACEALADFMGDFRRKFG